ncbi:V/A-type H+-transporting ATPase subunit I [Georgenia soli]|uniref:V/A-type H+-transporting ATPase subunit I n=1 Tax=Georgenia soli TaxID=638953 RepID=A0A2A9EJV7_9MICO|nr:V-type ATPase 116kDa subunit family protein [Georgenia soli]PFG38896.1 V/A-type H+-transporting ATPase subunit I [Georgenia soli]
MPWRDLAEPVRMQRVALVAPATALRAMLVEVADAGTVELERPGERARPTTAGHPARLAREPADPAALEAAGRSDLLAGEHELTTYARAAVLRGEVAALAGWTPATELPGLGSRLAPVGGAVVPLAPPRGIDPPTLLRDGGTARRSFTPLVETYGTVPYADVDPTVVAAGAYMLMFGMMFGDAGHGLLLVLAGLLIRAGRPAALARLRRVWPFVVGAGLFAVGFGVLYGEFFGPTGVLPVLWVSPLDEPLTLLAVALGVGAVLLAVAQGIGTVNRWREGGWAFALSSASGVAGAALLAGLGVVVLGAVGEQGRLVGVGVVVMVAGVVLAFLGFLAASGGGGAGVTQAAVEVFDAVLRLGTNLVSFARLAAFGLTHAALGMVVWDGTTTLAGAGTLGVVGAVVLFVVGNAVTFTLEALVAGVQALRLEYYELFSRIFTGEGRAFRPWHVPLDGVEPGGDTPPVPRSSP